MTRLPAGPLRDTARLGGVRADLAGVVPRVAGPARVPLPISPRDRDRLNPGPSRARAITG
jgi:hypothetical protein